MKQALSLSVVQQYGVPSPQDKTVTFIEDGQLSAMRCVDGLADAEYAWLADVQCAVRWRTADASWWLQRGSDSLNCSVNDVLLAYGDMVRLQASDRLEIGMLRLLVVMPEAVSSAPADLAQTDHWPGHAGPDGYPFDMVRGVSLPAIADYAPVAAGRSAVSPADALFAGMFKEYLQAIADPDSLHMQQPGNSHGARTATTPQQADYYSPPAAAGLKGGRSLADVVFGRQQIDHVFVLSETAVTIANDFPTGHCDILHQFAGDIMRTRTRPPALTRREHHAISPDSHFTLARATSNDPQQE